MKGKIKLNDQEFEVSSQKEANRILVSVNDQEFAVQLDPTDNGYRCQLGEHSLELPFSPEQLEELRLSRIFDLEVGGLRFQAMYRSEVTGGANNASSDDLGAVSEGAVPAFMPGNILRVMVEDGAEVHAGDVLLILEAMKMENEVKSPISGTVEQVLVSAGVAVNKGQLLVQITPPDA